jgi:hypothetical protein
MASYNHIGIHKGWELTFRYSPFSYPVRSTAMTRPKTVDIWRYPYLWNREEKAGEDGGRIPRPTALSAVVPVSAKSTLL